MRSSFATSSITQRTFNNSTTSELKAINEFSLRNPFNNWPNEFVKRTKKKRSLACSLLVCCTIFFIYIFLLLLLSLPFFRPVAGFFFSARLQSARLGSLRATIAGFCRLSRASRARWLDLSTKRYCDCILLSLVSIFHSCHSWLSVQFVMYEFLESHSL